MPEFRDAIEIAAAPADVFTYLTTNAGLTAWMGEYADLDPRPGGRFAVDISGYPVRGEFVHVESPHRVVVTWGFTGDDDLPAGASTVEFTLTPIAGGTRVDLHHAGLPEQSLEGVADGWRHFVPRLGAAAAGRGLERDAWRPLPDRSADHIRSNIMTDNSTTTRGTTTGAAVDTVLAYHRAWTGGDVDGAMRLVADDIECRAPGVDLHGKDQYHAFIAGFAPMLTGIAEIAAFAGALGGDAGDSDRVALFYYPQTAATATAPAAECFTVRGGRITESVLVFDRLSYGPPPSDPAQP